MTLAASCACSATDSPLRSLPNSSALAPQALQHRLNGRVYASDGDGGGIYVYREKSLKLLRQFGQFSSPTGLATDRGGNLYVTDDGQGSYDGRIYVIAPNASQPFLTLDDKGALPSDVAVGPTATVFVANGYDEESCGSSGDVRVYAKGESTVSYIICDSGIGQPFSQVNGVAVDRHGDVYVTWENARYTTGRIREFTPGRHYKGHFLPPVLQWPYGIAIDSANNVIVTRDSPAAVDIFAPGGRTLLHSFANEGDPLFVTLDASQQHLYVTDALANKIDVYAYATQLLIDSAAFPGAQLDGVALSPAAR